MSQTNYSPEVQALLDRHATACELKMPVDRERIADRLTACLAGVSREKLQVRFLDRADEISSVVIKARAAWDARAARDAWAARAAWDARAARDAWTASWDCSWLPVISIGALERADRKLHSIWLPLLEAFEAGAWLFWITADELVVAERPSAVRTDDRRRLHHASEPAFSWLSDIREFYIHGVHVPSYIIEQPETITITEIESERNAEVRRVMIERYGRARFLTESGAAQIHADDFGILYRKEVTGDEPIVMVKVINATPDPAGTFKDYFLRVPPTMRAAREAVAWTFEKEADAYAPAVQT